MTFTTIRRRGQLRKHLYNGRSGTPERSDTLCGMRMVPGNAIVGQTDDASTIDCEDCLISGIRLAARRDELRAARIADHHVADKLRERKVHA